MKYALGIRFIDGTFRAVRLEGGLLQQEATLQRAQNAVSAMYPMIVEVEDFYYVDGEVLQE